MRERERETNKAENERLREDETEHRGSDSIYAQYNNTHTTIITFAVVLLPMRVCVWTIIVVPYITISM